MANINSPTPDATAAVKGKIALTGVLSGTAANPALRLNRQNDATNTTATGARMESGWGFILGNGTTINSKIVTFGTAFTSWCHVIAIPVGIRNDGTNPTGPGNTPGGIFGGTVQPVNQTLTGFDAYYFQTSAVATNVRVVYTWFAIGV